MAVLDKQILKNVSRSFYLSMRVLPMPMREPISLGYLLARASDTLADTEGLDAPLRLEMLGEMASLLHGGDRSHWLARLSHEITPRQSHAGERVLLENMQGVFSGLDAIESEPIKQAVLTVMQHILHGQRLDIERFELGSDFLFSEDDELEQYCYFVAGSVGEFWTTIGNLTLPDFSSTAHSQLMGWGINYGKGLQLINILRDLPHDLKAGRCYLPNVDVQDTDALMAESTRWRKRARLYLGEGFAYAQALRGRRTRMATALPGLIGERTLDLMDNADWDSLSQGVKVTRREVYRCAWDALIL